MGLIFNGNGDVIKAVDGSLTVEGLDLGGSSNVNAGIGTFSNLNVTGVLTYEDVKNVDSVGIVTAREGVFIPDNKKLQLGNAAGSADLEIFHDGSHSYVKDTGTGDLVLQGTNNVWLQHGNGENALKATQDAGVELRFNNLAKLETTNTGVTVTGGVTATSGTFSGDISCGEISITDSIYHVGDLNTRIRFPSADTISFETAGSERLNIASNGDVTITNTSSNPQLALISANDGISEIQFGDGNDAVRGNILYRSGSAGDALCFNGYNNTERMRITSTGQLLLGINNAVSSDVNFQLHSATSGTGPIFNMTNDSGDCRIFFGQDSSGSSANAQGQIRYNVGSNYLSAYTSGSERFRIDSSGNLIVNKNNARNHACIILSKADAGYAKLEFDVGTSQKAYVELDASEDLVHYGAAGVAQVFYAGGSQVGKLATDGSTYWGPSGSTEAQMQWTHDTNQRPHIFWGKGGGAQPSDGCVVVASPQTDICSQRVGAILFGSATSGGSGNTGLKAGINCVTNASPGSDFNAGGNLIFQTKPNNSTIVERLRIDSSGRILYGTTSSTRETSLVLVGNSNSYTTNPGVIDLFVGNTPSNLGSMGQICFGTQNVVGARIDGRADQDWTLNSARGSHLRFLTCANGSTSLTERLRITNAGDVLIGSTSTNSETGKLDIYHAADDDINNPHIRLHGAGNNDPRIEFGSPTNSGEGGYIMYNDSDEGLYIGSRMATYSEVNICTGMNDGSPTSNKRFTIDSSGRITKPAQPRASILINSQTTISNAKVTNWASPLINVGSFWDTSNKRFVAPIAGVYMFGGNFRIGAPGHIRIVKFNLQLYTSGGTHYGTYGSGVGGSHNYDDSSSGYDHPYVSFTNMIELAAGAYVELHLSEVATQNTSYIQTNNHQSGMWGYLLM